MYAHRHQSLCKPSAIHPAHPAACASICAQLAQRVLTFTASCGIVGVTGAAINSPLVSHADSLPTGYSIHQHTAHIGHRIHIMATAIHTPSERTGCTSVHCPISGTSYTPNTPFLAGSISLVAVHPLISAELQPSQALKLGAEWLLWRGLHWLQAAGALTMQAPCTLEHIRAGKLHLAVELVQELQGCKWRDKYPKYSYSADTTLDSLCQWLELVWSIQTGQDGLSYQPQEERATSSKLDSALRIQAKRTSARTLKAVVAEVAGYMEDLHSTSGWTPRHTGWLADSFTKAVPPVGILSVLRHKLLDYFPVSKFVGTRAVQNCELVLQALSSVLYAQAQELAQYAMDEEDEQLAAQAISSINERYIGLNLTSKNGFVVLPASPTVGSDKMAEAVAKKLHDTLAAASLENTGYSQPKRPMSVQQAKMAAILAARTAAKSQDTTGGAA